MALSKSIVDSWFEQQQSLSDLTHNVIYQRLEEVVLTFGKAFGKDLRDMWCLSLSNHYALCEASDSHTIIIESDIIGDDCKAVLDGKVVSFKWEFNDVHIPTRWLYEDFEQELKDGIELYRTEHAMTDRIKKLQYSIERKLSKEELELISFK